VSGAKRRKWTAAFLAGLVMLGWHGALAGEKADSIADLMKAGRYADAYDAATKSSGPTPEALATAARTLLRTSIESDQESLRWSGLRAARALSDRELAAAARQCVPKDGRYATALALELLAHTDVAAYRDVFLSVLSSPFRTVRLRALRALAGLKDPGLADRFAKVLTSDPDPELRAIAAEALGQTGAPKTTPALYRALDDPEAVVRQEAVRALVAIHDPGTAGAIKRRLSEAAPDRRVEIIRLAALVPDVDLARALGPLLGDPDARVRDYAAGAILSILAKTGGAATP